MFEHFLSKTQNDCALRAQNQNARAGKKEGDGGKEFLPAPAFHRHRISYQRSWRAAYFKLSMTFFQT
ncbi:MAG: hypothetical protein WC531_02800 [Candidatus Paceibacterota bacterium]